MRFLNFFLLVIFFIKNSAYVSQNLNQITSTIPTCIYVFKANKLKFLALTINPELSDIYCMRAVHETNICDNCGYPSITNSHIKLRNYNFKCIYGINENKNFFYILNGPNQGYLGYGNQLEMNPNNILINLID